MRLTTWSAFALGAKTTMQQQYTSMCQLALHLCDCECPLLKARLGIQLSKIQMNHIIMRLYAMIHFWIWIYRIKDVMKMI